MTTWRRDTRLLIDTLLSPGSALDGLCGRAPVGVPLVVLGGLTGLLLVWQAAILAPVVRGDPLVAELPGGSDSTVLRFWILRGLASLAAPLGLGLRAAALASVLHAASLILGASSTWRVLLSLSIHLEVVYWLENACVTLLLWLHPPATLEELQGVRLHAGLDLFWHPGSVTATRALAAANAFTIWWAALLAYGLSRHLRWRWRSALVLALPLWAGIVGLRFLVQPR